MKKITWQVENEILVALNMRLDFIKGEIESNQRNYDEFQESLERNEIADRICNWQDKLKKLEFAIKEFRELMREM